MPTKSKSKTKSKKKPKPRKFTLAWIKQQVEVLKALGEGLQALMGKKPLRSKVGILANPDQPQSMSILTRGQARFVQMAKYVGGIEQWGGIFEGLEEYADHVMLTSPSIGGKGREQVISFVGAISESKLLENMGLTVKTGKDKE